MQVLLLIQSFSIFLEKKENRTLLGVYVATHFIICLPSATPKSRFLISANGLRTCKPSSLLYFEQSLFDKAFVKALRCY